MRVTSGGRRGVGREGCFFDDFFRFDFGPVDCHGGCLCDRACRDSRFGKVSRFFVGQTIRNGAKNLAQGKGVGSKTRPLYIWSSGPWRPRRSCLRCAMHKARLGARPTGSTCFGLVASGWPFRMHRIAQLRAVASLALVSLYSVNKGDGF